MTDIGKDPDRQKNTFDAMKVSTSRRVFNRTVASGLRYMAHETKRREFLTTAFYVEQVSRWFDLISSRDLANSFSKKYIEDLNDKVNIIMIYTGLQNYCTVKG
jgi:hypothetical protein